MKKFILLLTLFLAFNLNVKADNIIQGITFTNTEINHLMNGNNFALANGQKGSFLDAYNYLIDKFNNSEFQEKYYLIEYDYNYRNDYLTMYIFDNVPTTLNISKPNNSYSGYYIWYEIEGSYQKPNYRYQSNFNSDSFEVHNYNRSISLFGGLADNDKLYSYYQYVDSNFDIEVPSPFEFVNFYYNSNLILEKNKPFPKIKDLVNYTSWDDYSSNYSTSLTEVNLSNYEYVILSLKDYNTETAFSTDMFIKGSIGITPVYNFGQSSKDSISGSIVQDRCNSSYSDFQKQQFFILSNDLKNNAVYYVKSCSDNSYFKFDNNIFNITYIDESNVNDPVVNIDGKSYKVIKYNNLPSSATENEKNNYIPGESQTETSAIKNIINNVNDTLSNLLGIFTSFGMLITKLFTALPPELSSILTASFSLLCILGIIKFIRG